MGSIATPTPGAAAKPIITEDDFSSLPKVISWVLIIAEAFAVFAKLITLGYMRRFRWFSTDNVLIVVSLVFSIGLVVSVSLAGSYGLGQRQANLDSDSLQRFQKAIYASDMLFIVTLALSKMAVLVLLWSLTPDVTHHRFMFVAGAIIAVWGTSSVFVAAFQCSIPQTWAILSSHCIDRHAFWTYFGILNIITELHLILLPCLIISDLQTRFVRKLSVMSAFMLRVTVIGATIAELYFRFQANKSQDQTFADWPIWVSALFVQGSSIIFACVPFMKPFFNSLQSGFVRTDDVRRVGSRQRPVDPIRNLVSVRTSSRSHPLRRRSERSDSTHVAGASSGAHIQQPTAMQGHSPHASRPISNNTSTADGGRVSQHSQAPIIRDPQESNSIVPG